MIHYDICWSMWYQENMGQVSPISTWFLSKQLFNVGEHSVSWLIRWNHQCIQRKKVFMTTKLYSTLCTPMTASAPTQSTSSLHLETTPLHWDSSRPRNAPPFEGAHVTRSIDLFAPSPVFGHDKRSKVYKLQKFRATSDCDLRAHLWKWRLLFSIVLFFLNRTFLGECWRPHARFIDALWEAVSGVIITFIQ